MLAEFDRQYINPYFHSSLDNGSFVAVEPMAAAAITLARALHAHASGGVPAAALQVCGVPKYGTAPQGEQ